MNGVKVIFWNLYGTLISARHSDPSSLARHAAEVLPAFQRTIKNFGLRSTPARLQESFFQMLDAERETNRPEGSVHPDVRIDEVWFRLLEELQTDDPPSINFAREVALYFERQANPKHLQSRAYDVLVTLEKRGRRQGIIANAQFYTTVELSELLQQASSSAIRRYDSLFDPRLVILSFEIGAIKPDLLVFRRAVEILTRENIMPDDCVVVGSSVAEDIAPAQHTGFRTVLFAPEAIPDSAVKPDLMIHNLGQLLEWL